MFEFSSADNIAPEDQFKYAREVITRLTDLLATFVKTFNGTVNEEDRSVIEEVIVNGRYLATLMDQLMSEDDAVFLRYDFRAYIFDINNHYIKMENHTGGSSAVSIIRVYYISTIIKEAIAYYHTSEQIKPGFFARIFLGRK